MNYASIENDNINENFTPVFKKTVNSENVDVNKKWSFNGIKHMFYQSLHWVEEPEETNKKFQQEMPKFQQEMPKFQQEMPKFQQEMQKSLQEIQKPNQETQNVKQEGCRWTDNNKHYLLHQGRIWSHDASQWIHNGAHHMILEGNHWFTNDGNVWTPYTNPHWLGGQNEKNLVDYHPMEYPKATGFEKLPFQGRAITGRWEATGDYK